jgi:hypothetical protein
MTLEDGTDCSETSVRNYYYSLRNDPDELSARLLRGGSLKSWCELDRNVVKCLHRVPFGISNICSGICQCLVVQRHSDLTDGSDWPEIRNLRVTCAVLCFWVFRRRLGLCTGLNMSDYFESYRYTQSLSPPNVTHLNTT